MNAFPEGASFDAGFDVGLLVRADARHAAHRDPNRPHVVAYLYLLSALLIVDGRDASARARSELRRFGDDEADAPESLLRG